MGRMASSCQVRHKDFRVPTRRRVVPQYRKLTSLGMNSVGFGCKLGQQSVQKKGGKNADATCKDKYFLECTAQKRVAEMT